MKNLFVTATLLLSLMVTLGAQPLTAPKGADVSALQKGQYPAVFLIGDYADAFESLSRQYEISLLNACEDDMDLAFSQWIDLMMAIELYSEKYNYDIKGIKMWLKVFWAADGSIEHMAYYLKPNSRNIDTEVLSNLLTNFARQYKSSLSSKNDYSHYGSASFPTFYQLIKPEASNN